MPEEINLKSFAVFDEVERQRRLRMHCNLLTAFVASNFLSPNGYLAYTCNLNAMTAARDAKKQGHTNFLELASCRVAMQSAMNMAASRSFQAYLESSIDLTTTDGGVIYQNAVVNTLFLGLVNTRYNRERFPSANFHEWLPLDGVTTLLKMWAAGENRPECGAYVGFRTEGKKAKVIFPEYY